MRKTFTKNEAITWSTPNSWDVLALSIIAAIIIAVVWGATQMATPYNLGQVIPISLDPANLPKYAIRTILRMFIALLCSLISTFIFGTWAAKSKRAERIIIPLIDVMQSIPVLSFISITLVAFITLFKGSMLGPECAAIFAIFTSQVWNMTLSFYQSMRILPRDLREVAMVFGLSPWRKFWRIEVPFAMPGLLWNMMMSMSGSWFFVTASEAFSISNQNITLPGIGSYIALAISNANGQAILYAIVAMFLVILLYDQLLFRPLVYWTNQFRMEQRVDDEERRPWVVGLFQRSRVLTQFGLLLEMLFDSIVNISLLNKSAKIKYAKIHRRNLFLLKIRRAIWPLLLSVVVTAAAIVLVYFLFHIVNLHDVLDALWLGLLTGLRVLVLISICALLWIPIGVWIGFKPNVARFVQPIIQFLAAFPANLLFPLATFIIIRHNLNVDIWASPLIVLGTQWYILFNVIAGASAIPEDLKLATRTFGVHGIAWWRRLVLPGIMPYFITGTITAAGGAWNASIIAEVIRWGDIKLQAKGLGAYINHFTTIGDFAHIALGTLVMCLWVLLFNRLVWRPLYNVAIERFRGD